MKALLQRVTQASVSAGGEVVGRINRGLVIFLGVAVADTEKDAQYLVQKITNLRIFTDKQGKFNLSAQDIGGELLLVSQFTLLADTKKGRRPSFDKAAEPAKAKPLIEQLAQQIRDQGVSLFQGQFAAHMTIESLNDGPVNILLDSAGLF